MKIAFDLLTVVIFFVSYKMAGMFVAVGVAMALYTLQTLAQLLLTRKVDKIQWITLAFILILGGSTFLFHNEIFFKWKPTAVYWLFALLFVGSHFIGGKTAIERLLEQAIILPAPMWQRLNRLWALFFIAMGAMNLFVAYHFDTDFWVNFKLFGILGLTLTFVLLQALYLSKHGQMVEHNDDQHS